MNFVCSLLSDRQIPLNLSQRAFIYFFIYKNKVSAEE